MEKEIIVGGLSEPHALHCYKCDYVFVKNISVYDKVFEMVCPMCNKTTLELNWGKKK